MNEERQAGAVPGPTAEDMHWDAARQYSLWERAPGGLLPVPVVLPWIRRAVAAEARGADLERDIRALIETQEQLLAGAVARNADLERRLAEAEAILRNGLRDERAWSVSMQEAIAALARKEPDRAS